MSPHRRIPILLWPSIGPRHTYLLVNSFEFMLAVSAMLSGLVTALNPNAQTSLHELFGQFAILWAVFNIVSGGMIVYGLARPSVRVEVAGLCILAGAIAGQAVAITAQRGWIGVAVAVFYIGWASAALIRARLIVRLSVIIDFEQRRQRIRLDEIDEPREPVLDDD